MRRTNTTRATRITAALDVLAFTGKWLWLFLMILSLILVLYMVIVPVPLTVSP